MAAAARQAQIAHSSISRWESGKVQPSIPELESLLGVYRASPEERAKVLSRIQAPRANKALKQTVTGSQEEYILDSKFYGALLRTVRLRNNLSQFAFAKRIGAAQNTVSYWEGGSVFPNPELLYKGLQALQVTDEERDILLGSWGPTVYPCSLEELEARRHRLVIHHLTDIPADVHDLESLRLIYLLRAASVSFEAQRILVGILGNYGARLLRFNRVGEARIRAQQGINLAVQMYKGDSTAYRSGIDAFVLYSISLRHLGHSPKHCLRLLDQYRTVCQDVIFQSAIMSEQVRCERQLGLLDLAEETSARVHSLSLEAENFELVSESRRLWCEVLIDRGRPYEALEVFSPQNDSAYSLRRVACHQTRARAFTKVRDFTAAEKETAAANQLLRTLQPGCPVPLVAF